MSITGRQNNLFLAEDWKVIYQTFQNVDFTSYDFENLRRMMITSLRENFPEDFNDYIERNGVMETSVDKIAEIRTSNTGTCGLNSYGKKVSDVYDNLLSTTYSEEKNKCVYGPVEGINDSNSNDTYASVL